uniref:Equinox n=1 Tax=Schmidtea mediterranea TaxID=79327 RepID=A0A977THP9_SCHMD|nr:equinox [Schmidtea mediterranea]
MNSTPIIIVIFIVVLNFSLCCIELLNAQWSQMSIEERVERAEIVLVIRVIKKLQPSSKIIKFYSAECEIIDVLKGWQNFKRKPDEENGWITRKSIRIHGFGSALDCLSEPMEDEIYLFFGMFKIDSNLWASYFTSFGALENLNTDSYERSLSVLGLHHWDAWSVCSKKCETGIQLRKRNCVLITSCDYSWTYQYKFCNWQSCDNTILSHVGLLEKEIIDIKKTQIAIMRTILISILFKNQTQINSKIKDFFSLELIDENSLIVSISITHDAIINIKSGDGNNSSKFSLEKLQALKNEDLSFNVFINDSGIFVETFCIFRMFTIYNEKIRKFFSGSVQKLNLKVSKNVIIRVSTDSLETFKNTVCSNVFYDHSSNVLNASKIQQRSIPLSTVSPRSSWSTCSVTCGIGWQKRYRPCQDDECLEKENIKSEIRSCFIQKRCPNESCNITCQNNGQCVKWKCFCPTGYQGKFCQNPICNEKCKNGGKCIGPNICQCSEGFEGLFCEKLKCDITCENGGQCLRPNLCTCAFGYIGKFCEKRICNPPCQKGGICQKGNICSCPEGTVGNRCEKYECYPQCMNGGTCIGKNKCHCPQSFSGSFCENHICTRCYNGGKCVGNMCQCPTGFFGPECKSRICITGLKFRKIIKPVIVQFPVIVSNKMCIESTCTFIQPQRSVVVNKVVFKPYIDCL